MIKVTETDIVATIKIVIGFKLIFIEGEYERMVKIKTNNIAKK